MRQSEKEKVFFQDSNVCVSQSRFISNGKTYAMSNISSVSVYTIEKSRKAPIILIAVGIGMLFFLDGLRLFGILLAFIGGIWLYFIKNEYVIRIQNNAGEADGLASTNKEYIQDVVHAVNEAIVFRG